MRLPSTRNVRSLRASAVMLATATALATLTTATALALTLVAAPAGAATAPWPNDGGLAFTGDGAQLPTTPRDVWAGLYDRTITSLGSGGSGRHACVIDQAGAAVCVGDSSRGRLGIGTKYSTAGPAAVTTDAALAGTTLTDITTGRDHTCAITGASANATSGRAYCWGASTKGQSGTGSTKRSILTPTKVDTSGVLSGETLTAISAGANHTCAVATNGRAYCWGLNNHGQLGRGGRVDATRPVAVDNGTALAGRTLVAIDAGDTHTCAIDSVGAAYCWGNGAAGRLGTGNTDRSTTPMKVTGTGRNLPLAQISAGGAHTCANTDRTITVGATYCWGDNNRGQLGVGDTQRRLTPTFVNSTGAGDITTGNAHTCINAGNRFLMCWGDNQDGQLGDGTLQQSTTPVNVLDGDMTPAGDGLPEEVVATGNGTCTLTLGGELFCWGPRDVYLQGDGDDTSAYAKQPTRVASEPTALDGKTLTQVTDDGVHTCALTAAGQAFCWGYGSQGQLGTGTFGGTTRPAAVNTAGALAGVTLTDITAGEYHTCAIGSDADSAGRAYCWGDNGGGQLGEGTDTARKAPRPVDASGVLADKTLVDVTAGDVFTCALDSDGKAYCWGSGYQGQLGNGKFNAPWTPVAVSTSGVLAGKTLVAIDAGYDHVCAIDSAGAAYCWGNGFYGNLGNGASDASNLPVAVDTSGVLAGKVLVEVSSGDSVTCVIDSGGSGGRVYCWGGGGSGQIGDGTDDLRVSAPRAVDVSGVLAGATIESVSVGGLAVCALDTGGAGNRDGVFCWGGNANGQLGDGTFTSRTRPVRMNTDTALARARVTSVSTGRQTWMLTAQP